MTKRHVDVIKIYSSTIWTKDFYIRSEIFFQLSLIISELWIFIWTWGPMDPRCAKCVGSEGVRHKVNNIINFIKLITFNLIYNNYEQKQELYNLSK